MNLVDKFNKKVEELTKKEFPTAEKAWSQTNYGLDSIDKVQLFEEENLYDTIQEAIQSKQSNCFYALNESLDYTNIKQHLLSNKYKITECDTPFKYWVISWNL